MSIINYIKGFIASKNPAFIVIEANGIGYGLYVSLNTYSKLANQTEGQCNWCGNRCGLWLWFCR